MDALYYRKYFDFIRYFLRAEIPDSPGGDLRVAFTGARWPAFDGPYKRRLLELSSVRFLISSEPYRPEGLVTQIIRQNEGRLARGRENLIEIREFTIGGEAKAVLYEHPPYDRLPYRVAITPTQRELSFSVAMQPAVYDGTMPICGDGVEFRLEARDHDGRISPLYDRYIDPKHNPAERRWIAASVDLSRYVGQDIELLFTTNPGPAGDACADWAGWGEPRFSEVAAAPPAFRLSYDHEVKIYEYLHVLPRAALFSQVQVAADEPAALAQLAAPSLNIFQTAVVAAPNLDASDRAAIRSMSALPAKPAQAARIVAYSPQEVDIDASPDEPALLVLNDSDYPGWAAYVDGRRSKWITANYLFRGVFLKAGNHRIRFVYTPASFVVGAVISGTALLSLAAFIIWRRRSNKVAS